MNKELSGSAGDVLHALFFRGALVDGDLPSKAGAAELRELGYVVTQDTVTPFGGEHYFNFLTPAGQEFAISYLVESRFGKKEDFQIGAGETFINNTTLQGTIHLTAASDQCLMEPLTDTASACDNIWVLNKSLFGITPVSTAIVKLSDEMRCEMLLLPPFVTAVSSLRNQLATSSSRWSSRRTVSK